MLHSCATSTETVVPGNLYVTENPKSPAEGKEDELPPWLSQYRQLTPSQVKEQIQCLEYTLMEQGFLVADISQVVSAVDRVAVQDYELAAGMVDFLRVLLTLRQDESGASFATTPVLLAAVMHYAECVAARRKGIPGVLREALLRPVSSSSSSSAPVLTPKRRERIVKTPGIEVMESTSPVLARTELPLGLALAPSAKSTEPSSPYETEVRLICKGAAQVKRAECLAHAVLQHEKVTPTQAARLRDLYLVCMEEDWRSLALRVVACLYRLEGLLRAEQQGIDDDLTKKSPLVVQTAREAMRIYAPLAQRLGMHRLKAMIEERAFRLQYRRQYRAVSSLYHETGKVMQSVSSYLQTHVQQILHNDEALVAQLKTLQVVARVKEPYSFWRKVLNQRIKGLLKPSSSPAEGGPDGEPQRRTLSITHVNDVVALRVILTARKLEPDEPDDVTRAREQMLCYYVQHLIRAQWPETDAKRLKDYIANPKPNGYQSLHHTSQIASRGIKFPFEVQVRSAEMNAQAEFGVSAHWDYKLSGDKRDSLKSAAPIAALPVPKLNETFAMYTDDFDAKEKRVSTLLDGTPLSKSAVIEGYVDALVTAQEDMLRNQIYVFVMGDGNEGNEQGELISVPANSSIGDAIVEIEDLIPAKVQVWKNGRLASAQDKLDNGDVMMIAV